MRKKLTFSVIVLIFLSISIFSQNILNFVPKDSKGVFYFSNLADTYGDLKTVPTIKSLLLEPFNGELLVSVLIQMYFNTVKIDYNSFLSEFQNDLVVFIQEPKEDDYSFGFVIGPVKDPQSLSTNLNNILNNFTNNSSFNFIPIYENVENSKYLIMVQNTELYSSSQKGIENFEENLSKNNGLLYKLNTSDYQGEGYFYVDEGLLIGGGSGSVDPTSIDKSFINTPDKYNYVSPIFLTSGFIPKDVSFISDIINNFVDYEIIENLLSLSSGVEFSGNFLNTSEGIYLKLKTEAKIDEVIPILQGQSIKYKKIDSNNLEFYIEKQITNQQNRKETVKQTYYIWKANEFMLLSNKKENDLQKFLSTQPKLSDDPLFKGLSEKIGIGNVSYIFVDIAPIFKQYVPNIRGEYGLLINISSDEEGKLTTKFIVK
ncbi:hypothetical protein [Petrotoga sp. 9PWA.NaAc.5.4]|uniref:hypothetical protein n=1 Tax=Petrotoga sp. 9PWA.NaAc.5.4 TaxID=1434328 RepID=UPI000CB12AD3|nr:hypothetical protein [Petrotoga sp. 9PWA.NaAc.5.4]PNR95407.1 hypothetical protein X924_05065 [Petrotoga sp. 9PWA.NaAc.5.4]